jgi:hypothetical protein
MVLYRQSLQLSVQTYWRYLIALVLFTVGLVFVVRKIPVSHLVLLFLATPIVAILIIVAFLGLILASLLSILMFAGICAALKARGHMTNLAVGHVLRCAGVLFAITFIAYFAFTVLAWLVFWVSQSVGGPADGYVLCRALQAGEMSAFIVFFLILCPVVAYLSAIVVPFIAMLNGREMFGIDQPVFFLFGRGLQSLMPIMQGILYFGGFALAFGNIGPLVAVGPVQMVVLLGLTWAASWFFSHAVLIWETSVAELEAGDRLTRARFAANRIDPQAMRLARERKNANLV